MLIRSSSLFCLFLDCAFGVKTKASSSIPKSQRISNYCNRIFLERLCYPIAFATLSKISWTYFCGSISILFLFHCSITSPLSQSTQFLSKCSWCLLSCCPTTRAQTSSSVGNFKHWLYRKNTWDFCSPHSNSTTIFDDFYIQTL